MRVDRIAIVVLWLTASAAGAQEPQVIRKHLTAADAFMTRYVYVPFDVPEGTTRVEFEYAYDRANGANVIDLGLVEPGSLALGTTAFREKPAPTTDVAYAACNQAGRQGHDAAPAMRQPTARSSRRSPVAARSPSRDPL